MRARSGIPSACTVLVAAALIATIPASAGAQVEPPEPSEPSAIEPSAPSGPEGTPRALERAIADAEDADFASALAAFEEAESASDLTRDELQRLFAHRATVHFALGEVAAMEADLARLLGIAPDVQLPGSAPPPVREALERLRGAISAPVLEVDARPIEGGVEVRARVREGGADLVRGLRAYARVAPDGSWERGDGGAIALEAPPRASVDWYAEALGPGGVIVASEGSADRPRRLVVPDPPPVAETSSDDAMWWAIGGSGAAVVIGAIAAAVAIGMTSTTTTTIGGPALVL